MSINGDLWNSTGWNTNFADEHITSQIALTIAAYYTCVNVRAQTISALPGNVIQEKGSKKEVLTEHPAYYPLAHQPNGYMSSANMFLTSMIHSDTRGNSYIRINRNYKGEPETLTLLCPWEVTPTLGSGKAFYKYQGEMIPGRDMLHFRWFSYDGFIGVDPMTMHAETLGMARKQDRFSSLGLGTKPPGVLSYQGNLTPTQMAENQKNWKKDTDAGRTPVLSGQWSYQQIMQASVDVQLIESKKLTKQDIYGIMRVPPVFAQDFERATFSNAEQSDLVFVKHTIVPIIRVIEQEVNMKMFTEKEKKNTYWKFNLNGLLRGDLQTRQAFYQAMKNNGLMNANEIRSLEDLNGYGKDGEMFTTQGAQIPVDQLRDFYKSKVLPSVPAVPKNGFAHEHN